MDEWEQKISCAAECPRCRGRLGAADERILSVYDHEPVCMDCKRKEEERPDYEKVSKEMIDQCLVDVDHDYGDPAGYCYHHFYPYKCS